MNPLCREANEFTCKRKLLVKFESSIEDRISKAVSGFRSGLPAQI